MQVFNFWNFHSVVIEHQLFKTVKKSKKKILSDKFLKNNKNPICYRNYIGQTHFWPYNFAARTQTEMTNGLW